MFFKIGGYGINVNNDNNYLYYKVIDEDRENIVSMHIDKDQTPFEYYICHECDREFHEYESYETSFLFYTDNFHNYRECAVQ